MQSYYTIFIGHLPVCDSIASVLKFDPKKMGELDGKMHIEGQVRNKKKININIPSFSFKIQFSATYS